MGKVIDVKCPNCASPLKYNATSKIFKCEYCGSSFTGDELEKPKNENFNENLDTSEYVTYYCADCGAEIVADKETSATFCVYCGNTAILKNKLSGEFKPDYIIPFKRDKNEAIEAFKKINKGKPLTPKTFNDEKNIEKIRGLYIPFWLYDVMVSGTIEAKSIKTTTWVVGNIAYNKTDTYQLLSDGDAYYKLVPTDGSTRFSDDIMNTIEPFDYSELETFNPAYLSGFLAEKYDTDSEKSFESIRKRTLKSTETKMLNEMSSMYGIKTITRNNLTSSVSDIKYALLPVWMVNVKYKNKYYLFAMNGQTGEFVGNIPIDKGKAFLYTLITFVITFGLVILISYLIFKGGN